MEAEAEFRGRKDHAIEVIQLRNAHGWIYDSQMEGTE
jgi:hypothetical protein